MRKATCRATIRRRRQGRGMERVSQRTSLPNHARRHGRRNHASGTPQAACACVDQYFSPATRCVARPDQQIAGDHDGPQPALVGDTVERTVRCSAACRRRGDCWPGRDGVLRALRCQQKDAE